MVVVSGYADDTAVYLRERSDIPKVLEILDAFAAVSGLEINRAKSTVIELSQHDPEQTSDLHGLTLLGPREHCRYLGIQVGQGDSKATNWDRCISSVWSRLTLAREKTHTVEQRAQLTRAIAIPKFLYVARHCWPSKATVTKMHELIQDFVWGKRDGKRNRPWVPLEQASLSIQNGGLGTPCIRTELTTLAAMTIGKWAATASERELLLGDILWGNNSTRPTYITSKWDGDLRHTVLDTLWATGAAVVGTAAAQHARGGDAATVRKRAQRFRSNDRSTYHENGSYTVDVRGAMSDVTRGETFVDETVLGRVDPNWLPHASLTNLSWLLDSTGNKYKINGASFAIGKSTLGDLLFWVWSEPDKVTFIPRGNTKPTKKSPDRHFGRFCFALAYNFPTLLRRPPVAGALIAYSAKAHQHHDWILDDSGQEIATYDTGTLRDTTRVYSMASCDRTATRNRGAAVHFSAHPALTRIVQIWAGDRRWRPRRSLLKKLITRHRRREGGEQRDSRVKKDDHQVVKRSMDLVEWVDLRRVRATLPQVAQTLYRLKSNRFPLWNRSAQDMSCPNPDCTRGVYVPTSHVFWFCPSAKRHWQQLLEEWRCIGEIDNEALNLCVFALELPEVPSRAWEALQMTLEENERTSEARAALFDAANELWRFAVATTLHAIWTERLRRMEDPSLSDNVHQALTQAGLRRALTRFRNSMYQPGGGEEGRILARVRSALADALLRHVELPSLRALQHDSPTIGFYLLFFDGGSRGNPGPGGSGSIIVRVHASTHAARIVWVASMAYGSTTTTNNIAEYKGLVHGLRQAKMSGYTPLHVVGDSAMVLSLLRMRHSPKKPHLAVLYREARALTDDTKVVSWAHHYREFNKMADRAANIAMDTCASIQVHTPTQRDIVRALEEHVDRDVNHWLETSLAVEGAELVGPQMTTRERAVATRQLERRRTAVRGVM